MRKGNKTAKVDKIEGKINSLYSKKNDSQNNKTCHSKLKIDPYYCDELTKLLQNNVDLFAECDLQQGRTKAMEMKLDKGEQQPIRMRPYRTALKQRNVVDEAIDGMLEANIITTSKSPWSFPVVVVDKKDGSKRFCVDFRRLNQITKNYVWPLPHIDDILTSFGKSKVFSSLDLKSGYWQVPMAEPDKEKTAFTCHRGLFQFNIMPFGLANAQSMFQELMTHVLEDINGKYATAYLDDIVVFSENETEHLAHLENIFKRIRSFGLK